MVWETPCDIGNHTFCVSWENCDCKCHEPEKESLADFSKRIYQNIRDLAAVTATPKLREGDQQLPVPNKEPDIQSQVIKDIVERREVGIQRYGTALQPHNGRDALRDAYEEAIDLAMYLKQLIVERDSPPPQQRTVTGPEYGEPMGPAF